MMPVLLRRHLPVAMTVAAAMLAATPATAPLAQSPTASASDAMPEPLTTTPGNVERGRALVAQRQASLCLLCHQAPLEAPFQGDISTNLAGAGARWSVPQLRQRIVDARRLNPETVMPAFHAADRQQRVAAAWRGKPILDAQQVEDVVAWLASLK